MSKYTTGELAKLCGVSVRTVQYYDNRNILTPSELTEGGRRLYSEDDVRRMKIICFLRELGLSINAIGELLAEDDPGSVIDLLLDQQEQVLREEISQRETQLQKLQHLRQQRRGLEQFSVESIGDIAYMMEHKRKLRNLRIRITIVGLLADAIELGTLIYWIQTGIWWPFAVGMVCAVIPIGVWISLYYFRRVAYICPQCHQVFKPAFREAFWANHTPRTRKLTCPECGHKGFCVEVFGQEEQA